MLFETQAMLLSATTSKKGQTDADLHPVQKPEHALVRNKEGMLARCWLTFCWKHRAWSCQQQAQRAGQLLTYRLFKTKSISWLAISMKAGEMLTYTLFKTQSMHLSATSTKGWWDVDLQTVQNQEDALVSNKQEGPAQMLTYRLLKTQSMLLSAASTKGWWDVGLHTVQNPKHPLVRNKQEYPARCWLTSCSKARVSSCQQQAGRASQVPTYSLYKSQSILLSATSRKGQPDADLHSVQIPEHPPVSNNQEGPARC